MRNKKQNSPNANNPSQVVHLFPAHKVSLLTAFTAKTAVQRRREFQQNVALGCLADAILESIFEHYVAWAYQGATKNAKELLKLTHVCRRWRKLALACPRLWCNIDVCCPRLAQEFLIRGGTSSPITFVSSPGQRLPKLGDFEKLLRTADRVRQVDVALLPADMRLFLYRFSPHFGNILAMRVIQAPAGDPAEEIHIHRDLPFLRLMLLDGVTMRWNSTFNLTVLGLCRVYGTKAPSMLDLQLMLRNNPQLEWLALDRVSLRPSGTTTRIVELPRLRTLRLLMPPNCTGRIIAGLRIPPTAQTMIRIWDDNDQITSVFPVSEGRRHPSVKCTRGWTLSIRTRTIIVRNSQLPPFSDHKAPLKIEFPHNICVTMFPVITQVFDLFLLTTLELDFMHPDFSRPEAIQESTAVTQNFLAPLLNLETLRVCQALADILAPVLGECSSFLNVICPRLSCLSFGDPRQMWWNFPTTMNGDATEGWLKPVATGLRARHTLTRAKLEVLQFIGVGHINRDAANHLLFYVENIINSVLCPVNSFCSICAHGPSSRAGW